MLIVTGSVLKLAREDALVSGSALLNIFDKIRRHRNPGCLHFFRFGNYPSAKSFAFYSVKGQTAGKSNAVFILPTRYKVLKAHLLPTAPSTPPQT